MCLDDELKMNSYEPSDKSLPFPVSGKLSVAQRELFKNGVNNGGRKDTKTVEK